MTWLNYWYCFKELLSNFCLLIYMLIQRKIPYMWSLMEIRNAVNVNGYHHLWNSVKFLFQNNYQDFFFFSKKDLCTLWTDGTSSKLSNMYAFMTSEKKGALSIAIMHLFFHWHWRLPPSLKEALPVTTEVVSIMRTIICEKKNKNVNSPLLD